MSSCAHAAVFVLLAMAVAAAWPFGGTSAGVQFGLHIASALAIVWAMVSLCRTSDRPGPLPLAVLPLIGGLILGAGQMVELPAEMSAALSPTATVWRADLTPSPAASTSDPVPAQDTAVSLYPAATRNRLSLLVLGTICFTVAALMQSRTNPVLLMYVFAVGGAVLSFFGLAQKLTWDGRLYWIYEVPEGAGPFASFLNKNNAAGYLLVCLAAAIGSAVWASNRHHEVRGYDRWTYDNDRIHRSRSRGGLGEILLAQLANLDALAILAYGCVAIILTAVMASMSRGGWIALTGAGIVTLTAGLLSRQRSVVLMAIGPAIVVAIGALSLIGLSDAFETRINTLFDQQIVSQARIPHWKDGMEVVPDFWKAGSGLGTYRFVYPPYQERIDHAWYYHAENQYLETAVEAGVAGLVLVALMIVTVGAASWFLVRRATTAAGLALGFAGLFALTSQVIHGIADFALFIPAVTVLFAVTCGAVCGEAAAVAAETKRQLLSLTSSRAVSAACLSALLVLSVFGIAESGCKAMAEAAMKATTPRGETIPNPDDVAAAIAHLEGGLRWRPDDAALHERLAERVILRGRLTVLNTLTEIVKQNQELSELPDQTMEEVWDRTKPSVLHGRAWDLLLSGHRREFEKFRSDAALQSDFRLAVSHLEQSRESCPLLPWTHLRLAEVGFVRDSSDWDQKDVARARWLAPTESRVQFQCGLLDLNAGRIDSAAESWRQALSLNKSHLPQIMGTEGARLPLTPDEFVVGVLPDDPMYLIELGQRYRRRGRKGFELAKALGQRALDLATDGSMPEWDLAYVRGQGAKLTGDVPKAVESLTEAVKLRPSDFQTRLLLAELLTADGQLDEALSHVRQMDMHEAGNPKYESLMARIQKARAKKSFESP